MTKNLIKCMAILVLCASCRKTAEDVLLYPIAVAPTVYELKSGAGEGVEKTTNDNLTDAPMGVYGKYNSSGLGAANGTNVFDSSDAQEVSYVSSGTIGKWSYTPVKNWSINKYYRFRAFHPYGGSSISLNASSDVDNLVIGYSVFSGTDDLLVGFTALTATADVIVKPVTFNFVHALSALQFEIAFKNVDDIDDAYSDYLTDFYLKGVVGTGTLNYTHLDSDRTSPILDWYALAYDSSHAFYHWTADSGTDGKQILKFDDDRSNAVMVFDGTCNMVYAVPQKRSSASQPTYVYFKTKNGGSDEQSVKLPDIDWQPGKIYKYTLLVDISSVDVSLSIKEWNTVASNNNIYL